MYIHPMPKQYSIAEARASLPSIVDQAEAGHEIELTRRGRPVAVVMSLREFERLQGGRASFGDVYRRFLQEHRPHELGMDDDVFASTRDRTTGRKVVL